MAKWTHWKMGWGESCTLSNGLTLTASKDMTGGKFSCTVFNLRIKKTFETIEEAKTRAEGLASTLIDEARLALDKGE